MLSKIKKLWRTSRSLSPQKDPKDTTDKDLQASQSIGDSTKKKEKEKGKRKVSQPQDTGDVVETQNQDAHSDEVEIVENEFKVENDDEYNINEVEGEDSSEDAVVVEDESDIDDSFVGELVLDNNEGKSNSFSCLSPSEIVQYQEKEVSDIADLLSVPTSTSATLLRHFHWKRERFLTRYLENPQQVCQTVGVAYVPSSGAKLRSLSSSNGKNAAPTSCSICGDDELTSANSSALACNHMFCNECWENHLSIKINEGEPEIHCPHHKCNIHVPDFFIKKLVPAATFEKYLRFVTKNFVRENDKVRWCPTPGCSNAITFDPTNSSSDSAVVQCVCGYQFCFKCHHEAHAPATCDQMKLWDKESEVFNWRAINCRECPKCNVSVEKNGGCNHMTCQHCKYEWCWVCLHQWKGHADFFNCDKEKEEKKGKRKSRRKKVEEEREKKQVAMKRYLQYHERYEHHDTAQKAESEVRANAKTKMAQLQEYSTKPELQFIEKTATELQECRSVMKYTYIFSYYLFADNEEGVPYNLVAKDLFEMLQSELEKTTDRLFEVLENVLKRPEIDMGLKLDAINHTNLSRTKRENLLHAVTRDALFATPD